MIRTNTRAARDAHRIAQALAATTPRALYAPQPTRAELVEALRDLRRDPANNYRAGQLVQNDEVYNEWRARRDAVLAAVVSHSRTSAGLRRAIACACTNCREWRAELDALDKDAAP